MTLYLFIGTVRTWFKGQKNKPDIQNPTMPPGWVQLHIFSCLPRISKPLYLPSNSYRFPFGQLLDLPAEWRLRVSVPDIGLHHHLCDVQSERLCKSQQGQLIKTQELSFIDHQALRGIIPGVGASPRTAEQLTQDTSASLRQFFYWW